MLRNIVTTWLRPRARASASHDGHLGAWLAGCLFVAALVLFLLGGACSKDHDRDDLVNPVDPGRTGVDPPIPADVQARVGSRQVELVWGLRDSSAVESIAKYRIYRARAGEASALFDSTTVPRLLAVGLENGVPYSFAVSSVLDNRLEGKRSDPVTAVPGLFGLQIESGRERVNSTSVRLSLQAPLGTEGMKVANGDDPDDASVQPFVTSLNWRIPTGDGSKTVSARFISTGGNESTIQKDEIILDTRADILSISFAPESAEAGETVHFRMDSGETFGEAEVRLGNNVKTLSLRDDGMGGDLTPDDGVYELDYVVEDDLVLVDATVVGSFTDEAGNGADDRVAPGRLTVYRAPDAVTLEPITSPGPRQLFLEWSQAVDSGRFSSYRVFRARVPGVDTTSTRTMVREVTGRTTTTYTDTDLDPDVTYYYRVYVYDSNGFGTPSNEESGRPRRNPPPDPVTLHPPTAVSEESVSLSWTQSLSPDFDAYRVYRGVQVDLDSDPERRLLTTLSSASQTSFEDTQQIEEGAVYYYRVDVLDDIGQAGKSNVVSATIPDLPPTAVVLDTLQSVGQTTALVSWSENDDRDFAAYELRRSLTSGVSESSPLIASIDQARTTNHLDEGLTENTDYYYRVFVVDHGANSSGSNEIRGTTANEAPPAVTLTSLTEVPGGGTAVQIDWTTSSAHDFASYKIYRDTSPAVGPESDLVRTIHEIGVTSYIDSDLSPNTRYYYRVFVVDTADGMTGSNEESILTSAVP